MKGDWSVVEWNSMYVAGLAAVDQRGVGGRWGSQAIHSLLRPPHTDRCTTHPAHRTALQWRCTVWPTTPHAMGRALDVAVARRPSMRWPRPP